MRIAIVGSRGIPARYGGFETQVEHLAPRLAARGHRVRVACEGSKHPRAVQFEGVHLVYFPLVPPQTYSLRMAYEFLNDLFFLTMLARDSDVIYCLGSSAGCAMFVPRVLSRTVKLVVNIDGIEWKRGKFRRWIRAALKVNSGLAMVFANRIAIDSRSMAKYVLAKSSTKASFAPNGVEIARWPDTDVGTRLLMPLLPDGHSLDPNGYWLVLARLEPENNIGMVIDGYRESNSRRPLVIVGSFSSQQYERDILSRAGRNNGVLFVGSQYDESLINVLRKQAFGYIHGHSVGGTNPSLLEAMVAGNLILAHDNEFNRETCDGCAHFFGSAEDLSDLMRRAEAEPRQHEEMKIAATKRVSQNNSWEVVVPVVEALLTPDQARADREDV